MCYYEQSLWGCGYWCWGRFRQQCPKATRIGETCGLKLVFCTVKLPSSCKVCEARERKNRRIKKMEADIERWKYEGSRDATISRTMADLQEARQALTDLDCQHYERKEQLVYPHCQRKGNTS